MATHRLIIPGDFSSHGVQVLPDAIMPSAGALYLVDYQKSGVSTVPLNGQIIPNLAASQAAVMTAVGASSMSPSWTQGTSVPGSSSPYHRLEVTPRGGVHGMFSRVAGNIPSDLTNNRAGFGLILPDAIATYLVANTPGHSFYISMWRKSTRTSTRTSGSPGYDIGCFDIMGSSTSSYGFLFRPNAPGTGAAAQASPSGGTILPSGSHVLGSAGTNVASLFQANMTTWAGTKPGGTGSDRMGGWWGIHGAWATSYADDVPSWVGYRFYIEDLTVSGRAYSTVAALDLQLFNQAFNDPTGRFYGDTYSEPTTVLP